MEVTAVECMMKCEKVAALEAQNIYSAQTALKGAKVMNVSSRLAALEVSRDNNDVFLRKQLSSITARLDRFDTRPLLNQAPGSPQDSSSTTEAASNLFDVLLQETQPNPSPSPNPNPSPFTYH